MPLLSPLKSSSPKNKSPLKIPQVSIGRGGFVFPERYEVMDGSINEQLREDVLFKRMNFEGGIEDKVSSSQTVGNAAGSITGTA